MKKILTTMVIAFAITACDNRTAAQRAKDVFEAEVKENEQKEMQHERYIDSLANVASGLDGETLVANRQNALNILKNEYPEMAKTWVKVQESIDAMEVYGENDTDTE